LVRSKDGTYLSEKVTPQSRNDANANKNSRHYEGLVTVKEAKLHSQHSTIEDEVLINNGRWIASFNSNKKPVKLVAGGAQAGQMNLSAFEMQLMKG
jgi:hypothetical protein